MQYSILELLSILEFLVGLSVTYVSKVPIWKALDFNGLRQACVLGAKVRAFRLSLSGA